MPSPEFRHRSPVRQICEKEADSARLSLGPLLLYNHFGGLFHQLAHSLVGPLSTACTMCRSSLLRVFMCLCDLDSDRRGCLALGTILARVPSGQTSGSDFLVAHTQLADHNQCRDNAICVSPGPMKIYLHHGQGARYGPHPGQLSFGDKCQCGTKPLCSLHASSRPLQCCSRGSKDRWSRGNQTGHSETI